MYCYFNSCVCVCWGVDICVQVQVPTEVTDPLKQEVQAAVSHLQWLLGSKPEYPDGAAMALKS